MNVLKKILPLPLLILVLVAGQWLGLGGHEEASVPQHALHEAGVRAGYSEWQPTFRDFVSIRGEAVIDQALEPGQVVYTGLDALGRTQAVYARLTAANLKTGEREREDISHIRPSGWVMNHEVTVYYDDTSRRKDNRYHGYFYNRSHLLAHVLGGDDEAYNMVTGTRLQNVGRNDFHGGMQYAETKARDYLKEHPKASLYYLVTPLYVGNELVPRSVLIDLQSEDKQLNEEIEVYNVMPGYRIDYATGRFYKLATSTKAA